MAARPTVDPWVLLPRTKADAPLRMFCFPYAGGGASIYRTWASGLPDSVAVCPVQLPGRESRLTAPAFTRLSDLLQTVGPAIRPYLDRPFVFFGHSMGALISFELTRYLRAEYGLRPVHLFISGQRAPHVKRNKAPIHELPDAEFIEELRRLKGTPEEVLQHADLMQLMLPALRADFALYETYVYTPEPPLECPISAYGGTEDDEYTEAEIRAWQEVTSGDFSLKILPGDHFFVHSARPQLLQALSEELRKILNPTPGQKTP